MVKRPEEYRWSSYHANAWGDDSMIVCPHSEYVALAGDEKSRCYHYRELFKVNLSEEDLHVFRRSAHYSIPVGSDRFVQQIEKKIGRSLLHMVKK